MEDFPQGIDVKIVASKKMLGGQ